MRRLSLSPPFSLTHGLQHFLPARHEILKPSPTVSHGDLLQEVSHSSVILPLLFHPSASRVIHSPVSILRIKVEAHSSIQAKVPGSTVCLSSSQRHVILACRVRGSAPPWERKSSAFGLDRFFAPPGSTSLGPANVALCSPQRPLLPLDY